VRLFAEPFDKLLDATAQQTGQAREEVAKHPGGHMVNG
jgi:hypothetical protein